MPSRHPSRSPSRTRRRSRSRSRDRRRRRRRSRSASGSPRSRTRSNSPSRRGRDRPKRRSHSRERGGRSPGKPNSDLIKQLLNQQQLGANPQVTKQARRIYVGNMPLASSYTESSLIQFFTNAATNCGITTPHPVVSVWTSSDGSFCFVEMRSVSDATRSIDRWDGLQLGGRTLRVGRPADYSPVLPHLDTFVMDIAGLPSAPEDCTGRLRASTLATPILKDGSETDTSNVLILSNMCTRDELLVDEEYEDVLLDIRTECQKFGAVDDVWVPKPSKEGKEYDPPGVGKILVCFQSMADALSARQTLKMRAFNGRPVGALYFPLQQFEDRFIQ